MRKPLKMSYYMWFRILRSLRIRGEGVRESGAFLLSDSNQRKISDYLLYDDIDPHALDSGIVDFNPALMGKVWEYCEQNSLKVVADIHTHPKGASIQQSRLDKKNPAIPKPGYIAIIVPDYSENWFIPIKKVGVYKYLGNKKWDTITNSNGVKLTLL